MPYFSNPPDNSCATLIPHRSALQDCRPLTQSCAIFKRNLDFISFFFFFFFWACPHQKSLKNRSRWGVGGVRGPSSPYLLDGDGVSSGWDKGGRRGAQGESKWAPFSPRLSTKWRSDGLLESGGEGEGREEAVHLINLCRHCRTSEIFRIKYW